MPNQTIVSILERKLQGFGNAMGELIDLSMKSHHCEGCLCDDARAEENGNTHYI
jgi:hypothetical protein